MHTHTQKSTRKFRSIWLRLLQTPRRVETELINERHRKDLAPWSCPRCISCARACNGDPADFQFRLAGAHLLPQRVTAWSLLTRFFFLAGPQEMLLPLSVRRQLARQGCWHQVPGRLPGGEQMLLWLQLQKEGGDWGHWMVSGGARGLDINSVSHAWAAFSSCKFR